MLDAVKSLATAKSSMTEMVCFRGQGSLSGLGMGTDSIIDIAHQYNSLIDSHWVKVKKSNEE